MPRFDYLGKKPGTKADPEYPAAGPPAQSPNRTPGLTPPLPHRRPTYRPAQKRRRNAGRHGQRRTGDSLCRLRCPRPALCWQPKNRAYYHLARNPNDRRLPSIRVPFRPFSCSKGKAHPPKWSRRAFFRRSKDRGYPRALITLELMSYLASGDIPKTNNLVVSTRCDGATIGRKRDGIGFTGTSETTKLFAGRGLPETNRAIFARRCHQSPIRGDGQAANRTLMAFGKRKSRPGTGIPEANDVAVCRGQDLVIGRKGQ